MSTLNSIFVPESVAAIGAIPREGDMECAVIENLGYLPSVLNIKKYSA
jgi:acyl-CoA synthetase (NDP forming)